MYCTKFIVLGTIACALLACKSVGPDFKSPNEPVPGQYMGITDATAPDAVAPDAAAPHATAGEPGPSFWWQQFHDAELDRLEDRAADR